MDGVVDQSRRYRRVASVLMRRVGIRRESRRYRCVASVLDVSRVGTRNGTNAPRDDVLSSDGTRLALLLAHGSLFSTLHDQFFLVVFFAAASDPKRAAR